MTSEYGSDSNTIFDDDRLPGSNLVRPITVGGKQYKYVQWGYDDQLPYRLRREIMSNMITAQCRVMLWSGRALRRSQDKARCLRT